MSDVVTFDGVRSRLDEIADEVNREGISLDEALALYEEAVQLGLKACDLSESDLNLDSAGEDANQDVSQAANQDTTQDENQSESGVASQDVTSQSVNQNTSVGVE